MTNRQENTNALHIEKLAILRGNRLVLRDFSLRVGSGETVWIKGANGSGKSTLLRAIAGLLPSSAGTCECTGTIALADENTALDSDQTADEALRYWGQFDGADGRSLEAALQAMDLIALADIPIRFLSAGQKRRVALARLISGRANIWLLDEPYNALDQANVARLDSAIAGHCAKGGIALIASHIAPGIGVSNSLSLDKAAKAFAA